MNDRILILMLNKEITDTKDDGCLYLGVKYCNNIDEVSNYLNVPKTKIKKAIVLVALQLIYFKVVPKNKVVGTNILPFHKELTIKDYLIYGFIILNNVTKFNTQYS